MMRATLLLATFLVTATPAFAQQDPASGGCSGFKWPVDREETAFAGEGLQVLEPGTTLPGLLSAAVLKLKPQAGQTFSVQPTHKPHGDQVFAGEYPISALAVAGVYQVTLSDRAWIDVIQGGKLLKEVGFTDSKDCHSVRKSVRFDLVKGPASVLISDAASDTLKIDLLPPGP